MSCGNELLPVITHFSQTFKHISRNCGPISQKLCTQSAKSWTTLSKTPQLSYKMKRTNYLFLTLKQYTQLGAIVVNITLPLKVFMYVLASWGNVTYSNTDNWRLIGEKTLGVKFGRPVFLGEHSVLNDAICVQRFAKLQSGMLFEWNQLNSAYCFVVWSHVVNTWASSFQMCA